MIHRSVSQNVTLSLFSLSYLCNLVRILGAHEECLDKRAVRAEPEACRVCFGRVALAECVHRPENEV